MTTRKPGLEEDAAPFERTEAETPAQLDIRPVPEPAPVEDVADRIIKRFPRTLAKLAE
jgi:hypothetical protein